MTQEQATTFKHDHGNVCTECMHQVCLWSCECEACEPLQEQAKPTLAEVERRVRVVQEYPYPEYVPEPGRMWETGSRFAIVPMDEFLAMARAVLASQTALRNVEWKDDGAGEYCPSCWAAKESGHRDDCELRAALLDQGDGDVSEQP